MLIVGYPTASDLCGGCATRFIWFQWLGGAAEQANVSVARSRDIADLAGTRLEIQILEAMDDRPAAQKLRPLRTLDIDILREHIAPGIDVPDAS